MSTLFISDLHLTGERPEINRLFLRFLAGEARGAEALYVLGDLFEAWLGDDLILPDHRPILEGFRQLTESGVPVYVMRGNRDFLLGEGFEAFTGCTLIADPHVIDLYGRRTVLMHGDTLCTDDLPYQQLRSTLRNPAWIADFLERSPEERIALAHQLRDKSKEEISRKAQGIMDVNAAAVEAAFRTHQAELLIHGHTHRPAAHHGEVDGTPRERHVLTDWYREGHALACTQAGCTEFLIAPTQD